MADVRLAGGIRKHLEDVALRRRVIEVGLPGVGDLPGPLALPHLLPVALDRVRLVRFHRCDITRPGVARAAAAAAPYTPARDQRIFGPRATKEERWLA